MSKIQDDLERVRATEQVLADQVSFLDEVATDAETRSIVSGTPMADRDGRDARKDLDRHRRLLEDARRTIKGLLDERDRRLDQLFQLETAPGRRDTT